MGYYNLEHPLLSLYSQTKIIIEKWFDTNENTNDDDGDDDKNDDDKKCNYI